MNVNAREDDIPPSIGRRLIDIFVGLTSTAVFAYFIIVTPYAELGIAAYVVWPIILIIFCYSGLSRSKFSFPFGIILGVLNVTVLWFVFLAYWLGFGATIETFASGYSGIIQSLNYLSENLVLTAGGNEVEGEIVQTGWWIRTAIAFFAPVVGSFGDRI